MKTQMRTRVAAVLMVLAMPAGHASAQISLSTAVDLALKNDPRIAMAQADEKKASSSLDEARSAYVPSVSATGGYGKSIGPPLAVPVAFSLTGQSLVFNLSQKDNIRAAEQGLKASRLSLQEIHDQVAEDIVTTYIALDSAERREQAVNEELGLATRLVAIVQERLDAGQDTRIELLHAQRTAAQIRLQELRAQDEIAALNDHLTLSLGLTRTQIATVPGSIPPMPKPGSLKDNQKESLGVQSAFAAAQGKLETAFGVARSRYSPQVVFGFNYSHVDTSQGDYLTYYPDFKAKSYEAVSAGLQIQLPLFDPQLRAKAGEAAADANRARAEAQSQQNVFLEGRYKLQRSAEELDARSEVAELDFELAQEQLKTVELQLNSSGSDTSAAQMTPKDEQNAKLQERQRYVDVLQAQQELAQAEVSLMHQTGTLDDWLKQAVLMPSPR